mmetsp:Transcript_51344/g.109192  ORF Transcript_51344/g.109192 Transcript_51344/m.109192 type:complete len:122 (-) Transcript_51344:257-622(-)|eukprot:CAMPEP_0206489632 /NCGR_PEP_ID=MMETSP0324_2-20121206/43410_1 /ASSEMBLY_ACC=CAM_ASM_000836 /TAXON_ID=2866 /ORGANISM="Crypthecodinium cohnii, Strain Seligo" /LENGTH=121 /DNA_ID=CAMNT_0053969457 /DNA_START=363 /DNA_END=728 /DNA_ORIENTATION=-
MLVTKVAREVTGECPSIICGGGRRGPRPAPSHLERSPSLTTRTPVPSSSADMAVEAVAESLFCGVVLFQAEEGVVVAIAVVALAIPGTAAPIGVVMFAAVAAVTMLGPRLEEDLEFPRSGE